MTTYAIPVSESLAARLSALPVEKVNEVNAEITELLYEFVENSSPINPEQYSLSAEDVAAIREGLAAIDAGQMIDGETVFAEMFARVGLPYPPKP